MNDKEQVIETIKHGRWKLWSNNKLPNGRYVYFCSECTTKTTSRLGYCLECGAKMDLKG